MRDNWDILSIQGGAGQFVQGRLILAAFAKSGRQNFSTVTV
jgi:hypothetical protein